MLIPAVEEAGAEVRRFGLGTMVTSEYLAPEVDWRSVQLTDPHLYASGNPHAAWAAMRAEAPLHRAVSADSEPYVSVTRYADAVKVLGSSADFTSERGSLLNQLGKGDVAAGKMLVSSDPPGHTRLRSALAGTLTAKALLSRSVGIHAAARDLVDRGLADSTWDLAKSSIRFPMYFTGALMGVDPERWDDLALWTLQATAPDDPAFMIGTPARTLATSHYELLAFFEEEVRRHVDGGLSGDLIGALIAGEDAAPAGNTEETVYNCYSLLLGANATTPHTLCLTVLALMQFPDAWQRLTGDRSLIASAVEEGLRWSSPANSFLRYATRDVDLPSGPVSEGEAMAVWVGSANRDDVVFERPYVFDVGRRPNRHIAFGVGPHYCVGATLARMALNSVLTELTNRVAEIELLGPVEHLTSIFVAGVRSMPVRASPVP